MNIAIAGASGLVGTALGERLLRDGHRILPFVRTGSSVPDAIPWNPTTGQLDATTLADVDAVINLAGENIAGGRWTATRKQRIRDSRVLGTELIARKLAQSGNGPRILLNASAIGIYGLQPPGELTEKSPAGGDFLAGVVRDWEGATRLAESSGVRVVHLRFGLVLSLRGGALAKMLPAFRLGLGGTVGSGSQWWSWVALEDVVGVILRALVDTTMRGPVNVVAPYPVTSREFTGTLAQVLHRPAVMPMPAWALRLALGEMAESTLLASQRVKPARLQEWGYAFKHPELEGALRAMLAA